MRRLPARERRGLCNRERRLVLASHDAHHGQRRRRLRAKASRAGTTTTATATATGAAAAAGGALDDVRAASWGPQLAVDVEEARRLEVRRRGEYVEPERRLDHELLRVGASQDRLGRVRARVQHVPDPFGGDGKELMPRAVPAAEEERGNDEQAGHRFTLRIAPRGGRAEVVAYLAVSFTQVRRRFIHVVENERVGLRRHGISKP